MENLNKFEQDFDNIFNIKDYFIIDNKDEMKNLIDDFSSEEKIEKVKNGIFSCKINNKYMLLSKNDIKQYYCDFYKTLLKINKQFEQSKNLDYKMIICLINYVLIFNDNITFYSFKQKILNKIIKDNSIDINNIINSEYYYTILTNRNLRKSSVSWYYRFFLVNNFKDRIKLDNKININLLKFFNNFFGEENFNSVFLFHDINNLFYINEKESRNYHLWTYINRIFISNNFSLLERKIIIIFAFFILYKCVWDYSSFCFIKNFISKIDYNQKEILFFINYLDELKDIKTENNFHNYSLQLDKNLFINKKE